MNACESCSRRNRPTIAGISNLFRERHQTTHFQEWAAWRHGASPSGGALSGSDQPRNRKGRFRVAETRRSRCRSVLKNLLQQRPSAASTLALRQEHRDCDCAGSTSHINVYVTGGRHGARRLSPPDPSGGVKSGSWPIGPRYGLIVGTEKWPSSADRGHRVRRSNRELLRLANRRWLILARSER